ncbi:hypothetical protein V1478_011252, partial [Vespula squamosa]
FRIVLSSFEDRNNSTFERALKRVSQKLILGNT